MPLNPFWGPNFQPAQLLIKPNEQKEKEQRTEGAGSDGVFIEQGPRFKFLPQVMAREALEEIARRDYCWKSRKPSDEPWAIPAPVSNMHKPDASSLWIVKKTKIHQNRLPKDLLYVSC